MSYKNAQLRKSLFFSRRSCMCWLLTYISRCRMGVLGHFHGHMPRHQTVLESPCFLGLKGYKMNHEKLLLKNSFPKNNKEKNFTSNPDARDPMHAFSKICIDHLRIIHSPNPIYGPSTRHLIFKYRASKTQKFFFFENTY